MTPGMPKSQFQCATMLPPAQPIATQSEPLRSLTRRYTDGRLYVRDEKHDRHIQAALAIPFKRLEVWIRGFGYGSKKFSELPPEAPSPEALVYLYRHYLYILEQLARERRAHAQTRANSILVALLEAIQSSARAHLKVPSHLQDVCQLDVEDFILNILHANDDSADLLEVMFGRAIKCECIKIERRHKEPPSLDLLDEAKHDAEDDPTDRARKILGERALIQLDSLVPNQKRLLQRRYVDEAPATQIEYAAEIGMTDRTVRNQEEKAKAALRALLGES